MVWEAHTEYYSYQVWHVLKDPSARLDFGPITFPGYAMPICPLGIKVNALDIPHPAGRASTAGCVA
ncbi:MAG: hypothetical protein U0231_07945 [Nitrospiraceae bacterium]